MAVKASATISLYRIKEVTNTTNYYLLQSSTANPPAKPTTDNPGGNWSTTEPTYTEGSTNTLYTVIKTSYSDGSFEYTPVSKSSSYEAAKVAYNKAYNAENAVNNLNVGGRNILRMTKNPQTPYFNNPAVLLENVTFNNCNVRKSSGAWEGVKFDFKTQVEDRGFVEPENTFVYSIWGRISDEETLTDIKAEITADGTLDGVSNRFISTKNSLGDATITKTWKRFYYIFTVPASRLAPANGSIRTLRFEQNKKSSTGCYVMWACPKLEKGTIPTDWSPSPEDADDQIDNISIGGRNLIRSSANPIKKDEHPPYFGFGSGGNGVGTIETITDSPVPNVNKSFRIMNNNNGGNRDFTQIIYDIKNQGLNGQWRFSAYVRAISETARVLIRVWDSAQRFGYTKTINQTDGWVKINILVKLSSINPDETVYPKIQFGMAGNGSIEYIAPKLERGNMATDWTPAPEDLESSTAEVIVGTQTAATASWTGVTSSNTLIDKQQIAYWLPVASAANATLNLTLADGTTTGAIPLYYQGTTRLGTHYPAGSVVHLTYRENVTIGSTTIAKGWWGDANYNTNDNTYDRIRFNNNIVVKTAISADRLIVGDDSGYFHFAAGITFNIDKPILLAKTAKAAGATDCNNNYLSIPSVNLQNNVSGFTGEENATVYIVGILNGNNFVVDSSTPLTTTVPTSDDGKYYISLGYIYRNANHSMYLYPEHPIYKYVNGQFKNLSQVAYEAQYSISNLQIGGRNLALHSKTFEKILDGTASVTTSSKTVELSQLFTKENYAGKEITISWYGEASNLVLNDWNRHRYGVELSFPRTDGGTTYIGAWRTTHENWSGRFCVTGTIPKNWTGAIAAHHAYIQGYDVGSKIKIFKIKIESGNMMTDWTEAPEDSGSITKSPTAPADVTSVWFNTNDSMFYVYDNNSDSPTYQTWVIINDISGSFEEINRKFNQDIPNNIAQAIANNNIELANVYYTKEQVDAQLEIKDGEIRQTFNDWVTRVENTANGANEIVTDLSGYINTGTKDGSTYLELGNKSSDFKVKIENSRMAILYKNQEVTKWEQDIFEVETVISKLLHLGKFGFIVNDDNSVSFRKIDQ